MKRSSGVLLGTVAAALLLAGCNNNSNGGTPPTSGPNCGGPANQMEVLYPRPNAGAVPPTANIIYVAFNGALPSGNQYDLISNQSNGAAPQYSVNQAGQPVNGSGSGFFSVSASQIPSPHATPTFSNPVYMATGFPTPFGPLDTIQLYWNDFGTQCTPNVVVSSFTTK